MDIVDEVDESGRSGQVDSSDFVHLSTSSTFVHFCPLSIVLLIAWCIAIPAVVMGLYDPPIVYLTWQHSPTTTMTVLWITEPFRSDDIIYYRGAKEDEWQKATGQHVSMPEGHPYLIHRAELTQLRPNADYLFRPGDDGAIFKFRTMPDHLDRPLTFVVGGDVYHDGLDLLEKMNRQAASRNPSFALVGGDLAYTADKYPLYPEKAQRWIDWLKAWKKQMVTSDGRLIPIVVTIGNHETSGAYGQTPAQAPFFYALFPMENNCVYRALDFSNYLTVIALDSGHTYPVSGNQAHWLFHALETRVSYPHKLVFYHVPAYPSFRSYSGNLSQAIRKYWVPIFDQFGVNVVFEHHDHNFKRTYLLRAGKIDPEGTLYLGSGAWAVEKPRTPHSGKTHWYLATAAKKRHVFIVTIDAKSRRFTAIDENGNTIDDYIQITSKASF